MDELNTLRRAIEALSVNSYCRRYPAELRSRVATHARRRMASGESLWSVAASLGMGGTTLRRILAAGAERPEALLPVRVVDSSTSSEASTRIVVRFGGDLAVDHEEFEPGDCDDAVRGPGGVCPLPGYRPTPPPETVPDYIAAVHAQYRYRVPADVASQAGYSPAMVRQLEQRVVELRQRTPYSLYRWSQMMRREINFDDASEARLHQLILQWESENANLRILRREAGLSDEDYGYRSNLNNEVLLAAVQAEISQELFERLAVDLRYPHE